MPLRRVEGVKRVGGLLALSLVLASPGLAAPRLAAYGVDIAQTSVSGVSSGGAMAVQMHIAAFLNHARHRGHCGHRLRLCGPAADQPARRANTIVSEPCDPHELFAGA